MVRQTKLEYLEAIRDRYLKVNRGNRKGILDEFCRVCDYHRKHAIRLLHQRPGRKKKKPGRPPRYGAAERKVLEMIWLNGNRPCSKRLKGMLPLWLPAYEQECGVVPGAVKEQLTRISPRTLDRLMKPVRRRHGSRGRCGTRPGSFLRHQIPIQVDFSDVAQPGVMEADTVAHSGTSMDGSFVWSLTLTDIYSGWTENRAVWNKGYEGIRAAIRDIEQELPFRLTGFHSDNGGEFLNHHLVRYLQDRELPVAFSRGRPYHKDDTAHVEQKNYTHVRLLLGYRRIENPALIPPINELYRSWDLFNNCFCPSLKLVEKRKLGSRYIKTYDIPRTPHQRLMDSPDLLEPLKVHLGVLFANLNPLTLRRQIDAQQKAILNALR